MRSRTNGLVNIVRLSNKNITELKEKGGTQTPTYEYFLAKICDCEYLFRRGIDDDMFILLPLPNKYKKYFEGRNIF